MVSLRISLSLSLSLKRLEILKLKRLEILPLPLHLQFNKAVFMYKLIKEPSPSYLSSKFSCVSSKGSRYENQLRLPRPRLDIFKCSLSYSGGLLWNSLPSQIRSAQSLPVFKGRVLSYLASFQ
mgnify:CR=1 FL=1